MPADEADRHLDEMYLPDPDGVRPEWKRDPKHPTCSCCENPIRGRSARDLWDKTELCPACTFGEAAALEEYDD